MKRKSRKRPKPVVPEESLQITVPRVTKRSLKIRSAETGEPMRVIVLKALAKSGIEVPDSGFQDRRKPR